MHQSVARPASWQRLISLSTAAALLLTGLAVGGTAPAVADDGATAVSESGNGFAPAGKTRAEADADAPGAADAQAGAQTEAGAQAAADAQGNADAQGATGAGADADAGADGQGDTDAPEGGGDDDVTPEPEPEPLEFTVSVTGAVRFGSTLTTAVDGAAHGARLSYQWFRGTAAIPGATGASYVLQAADVGQRLKVRVSGVRGDASIVRDSPAVGPVQALKLTAAKPSISGKAAVGSTLTAKPGKWGATGVGFTYQWYRNGSAISGAKKATLKLGSADAGKTITVKVTGKKAGYTTASATSAKTAKVLRVFSAPAPKIGGSVKVGSTVSASVGTWKPKASTVKYQWNRDGKAIRGATKAKYKITSADAGRKLTVSVRGSKSGYVTTTKTSASKSVPRVLKTGKVSVSGSAKVGSTLRANAGTWSPKPVKLKYQWKRSGKNISGATKSTYRVAAGDRGHRISVTVTGSKSGYTTASKTSSQTGKVSYPSRTKPSSAWNCPTWAPIKGNASSMIYHVPGGAYYSRTKPEECFTTESAARQAGYRASKR